MKTTKTLMVIDEPQADSYSKPKKVDNRKTAKFGSALNELRLFTVLASAFSFTSSCTGVLFPGDKAWPGLDADHSPHLVSRSRMSKSCTYCPLKRLLFGLWWD
jgi:hypothetical protein